MWCSPTSGGGGVWGGEFCAKRLGQRNTPTDRFLTLLQQTGKGMRNNLPQRQTGRSPWKVLATKTYRVRRREKEKGLESKGGTIQGRVNRVRKAKNFAQEKKKRRGIFSERPAPLENLRKKERETGGKARNCRPNLMLLREVRGGWGAAARNGEDV